MTNRRTSRLYWRGRGGARRAYGDFRDYARVGGRREPLVPDGEKRATTDPVVAQHLLTRRLTELEAKLRGHRLGLEQPTATLEAFADEHLIQKAKEGRAAGWLATSQVYLERAVAFFGTDRQLQTIDVVDVERWVDHLRTLTHRGHRLAEPTILQHLMVLSNLFKRAQKRRLVPLGHNPVWALEAKPAVRRLEASWLEPHDAALYLEAARLYAPEGGRPLKYVHPLVATFLLTGGRKDEVLGLQTEDVSFERGVVHFHATPFRHGKRGKTRHADRLVPLVPQLREILGEYLTTRPATQLLFPAWDGKQERRLGDLRKTLRALSAAVGFDPGRVTTKTFRHTYCSAAVQLVDHGAPVALDTVRRWMGHGDETLVRHIYGHLGQVRHRAEVIEFRVDQHAETLGDRLVRLRARFGTTADTARSFSLTPRKGEGREVEARQ